MVWLRKTTVIGKQIKCTRVEKNSWDRYAVAVVNTTAVSTETVGHVPDVTKISQKSFVVAK